MKSLVEMLAGELGRIRNIASQSFEPIDPERWIYMRVPGKTSLDVRRGRWQLKMAAEFPGGDSAGTMLGLFLIARGQLKHGLWCGAVRPTIHGAIRTARRIEVDILDGCQSALNVPMAAWKRDQDAAARDSLPSVPVLTRLAQRIGVAMMHEDILYSAAPAEPSSTAVVIIHQDRNGTEVRRSMGNKALSLIGQAVMGGKF